MVPGEPEQGFPEALYDPGEARVGAGGVVLGEITGAEDKVVFPAGGEYCIDDGIE